MEETDALAALPRAYRLALRLRELGADDALISECLDVDPAALPTLHALAAQKLAALRAPELRRAVGRAGAPTPPPTG